MVTSATTEELFPPLCLQNPLPFVLSFISNQLYKYLKTKFPTIPSKEKVSLFEGWHILAIK